MKNEKKKNGLKIDERIFGCDWTVRNQNEILLLITLSSTSLNKFFSSSSSCFPINNNKYSISGNCIITKIGHIFSD